MGVEFCRNNKSRRLDRRIIRFGATKGDQPEHFGRAPEVPTSRWTTETEANRGLFRPRLTRRLSEYASPRPKCLQHGVCVAPNVKLRRSSRRHLSFATLPHFVR